jgi:hypothetical protein
MTQQPRTRRRQQQVSRWVRRLPGADPLARVVLPRIRSSQVLTDLAWRVFAPRHGAGLVDVALHPGQYLTGRDTTVLPVLGVVALGYDQDQVAALMQDLAQLQQRTRAFRPLLVLDTPAFAAARRHGYVVELVLSPDQWGEGPGHEDYLGRRLEALLHHYQLAHLLQARPDGGGLSAVDVALIGALADRLPAGLQVDLA